MPSDARGVLASTLPIETEGRVLEPGAGKPLLTAKAVHRSTPHFTILERTFE